ncbi:hypothetical protein [Lichenicoccus roseus]|uniref:hypothetical protein n=1 Tax=Lichenicoccus roseus TaxID=2683649 RepID=UPI001F107EA6|nr:hypothetical protein [Lichenicoccus roseus]
MRWLGPAAALVAVALAPGCAEAATSSASPPEQWYTGSLFSPSGAEAEAGEMAIEPYLEGVDEVGRYDSHGHVQTIDPQNSLSQSTLLKYGLTNRLSIYSLPDFAWGFGKDGATSGIKAGDLPIELQYRVLDADKPRFIPAVTGFLGVGIPTGDYDRLSRTQDGVGSGAWLLRFGFVAQSEVKPEPRYPLRIRLWAVGRQPFATVPVSGTSVYDTPAGFAGRARVGFSGNAGTSLELGLTQRWVLALDIYRVWADGTDIRGRVADGAVPYVSSEGASGTWNVGPAAEYNWSATQGAILGVIVPFDGHNTTRSITPDLAVNMVF